MPHVQEAVKRLLAQPQAARHHHAARLQRHDVRAGRARERPGAARRGGRGAGAVGRHGVLRRHGEGARAGERAGRPPRHHHVLGRRRSSQRRPPRRVAARIQEGQVVIYTVGFGDGASAQFRDTLTAFAEASGGRAFFPRRASDLDTTFESILDELSHQYILSYVSELAQKGGWRKLEIRAACEGCRVRAREGYRAPEPLSATSSRRGWRARDRRRAGAAGRRSRSHARPAGRRLRSRRSSAATSTSSWSRPRSSTERRDREGAAAVRFRVQIGGKDREVVSAELVEYQTTASTPRRATEQRRSPATPAHRAAPIVIVIDQSSLESSSRGVLEGVKRWLATLPADRSRRPRVAAAARAARRVHDRARARHRGDRSDRSAATSAARPIPMGGKNVSLWEALRIADSDMTVRTEVIARECRRLQRSAVSPGRRDVGARPRAGRADAGPAGARRRCAG